MSLPRNQVISNNKNLYYNNNNEIRNTDNQPIFNRRSQSQSSLFQSLNFTPNNNNNNKDLSRTNRIDNTKFSKKLTSAINASESLNTNNSPTTITFNQPTTELNATYAQHRRNTSTIDLSKGYRLKESSSTTALLSPSKPNLLKKQPNHLALTPSQLSLLKNQLPSAKKNLKSMLSQSLASTNFPSELIGNQSKTLSHQAQQQSLGSTIETTTLTNNCNLQKSQLESDIDSYMTSNELHYKHFKGTCICFQCTCGKHKCAVGRHSTKTRYAQPAQQSIYKISYVKQDGLPGGNVDHTMYESMKSKVPTIEVDSVAHNDYRQPDAMYYLNPSAQSFKPPHVFELNPAQVGRSHYKRDFLQWGCAPYQPIKAYSNRTTIDAMPFHGATTYTKDFKDLKVPKPEIVNKHKATTISKNAIPFLGFTTSQEFFKPFAQHERVTKFKATDELITGSPAFQGQFQTLNSKDYPNFGLLCPVERKTLNTQP